MSLKRVSDKKLTRSAWTVFFLYIGIYYFYPLIMNFFFKEEYNSLFKNINSFLPIVYVVFFISIVSFLLLFLPSLRLKRLKNFATLLTNGKIGFFISILFFVCGINFFVNYTVAFRHAADSSIGGEGVLMILTFAFRSIAKLVFFYFLMAQLQGKTLRKNQKRILFIYLLSFALTLNASVDIIFTLLGVIVLFNKEHWLIEKSQFFFKRIKNNLSKLILLFFLVVGTIFIGNLNKVGEDAALDLFLNTQNIEKIFISTSKRISTWYAPVMILGNKNESLNEMAFSSLNGVLTNLKIRIDILLKGSSELKVPEIWSINRANYLNTMKYTYNPRTGASPGMIGSAFYLPYFPFNFILIAIYTVWMIRYFSMVIGRYKYNIFGYFFLLFLFSPIFESPIDLINFIGPGFIYVFSFIAFSEKLLKDYKVS
ncbi:hypothetical protein [Mesonia aestuariivivens]|uniref:Oligosaccharide repeat unit polymerase n=1 Tax=Mesonia aestuariivivens TaxID=2796128 RepID=A0ABS6W4W9_9FLAO|nr:hypothetical protein [Mesonia aestuariivivens]MBW2962895.1 hypothetical protein [Mesonia aestuariivivens]